MHATRYSIAAVVSALAAMLSLSAIGWLSSSAYGTWWHLEALTWTALIAVTLAITCAVGALVAMLDHGQATDA